MPKLKIENISINLLKPYINNPRQNSKSIKHLEKSIKAYGFTTPITVDEDYVIVTGHSRYFAAKNIGMVEVPVVVLNHLTDAQIKQYRVADNKVQEHTEFDFSTAGDRLKKLAEGDEFFSDVFNEFIFDDINDENFDDEPEDEPEDPEDEDDDENEDLEQEKECICPYCLHEFDLDESDESEESDEE